jgi:penicillin-binding protein 1A
VSRVALQNADPDAASSQYLQGALLAMDPSDGHVAVMIGGRDFERSHFNRATQARRQPGSAFKPFVFAAALENGFTPATLITNLNDPVLTEAGEEYMPEDEHSTADSMTLRAALRMSSNRAAVQLLHQVGISRAVSYAKNLDLGSVPSVPSLALGSGVVTLQSLTSAYAAFANGGSVHKPVLIRRVTDTEGTVLFEEKDDSHRAISESTAFMMANMLADVINAGTAYRARREGFTLPAAGKTGTTNDFDDAWFVGFTPSLVAGVWVGFDQPQTIVRDGFAGDLAVPIWARFMKMATRGAKPAWLDRPKDVVGVNVCRMSGKLPNEGCTSVAVEAKDGTIETRNLVYTEYFKKGTQPSGVCPLHPAPSFLNRIAGLFGAEGEKPVSSDAAGMPGTATGAPVGPVQPGVAATSGQAPQMTREDENKGEKKKKRGFWSKIFGGGGKDEKKKDETKKPGGQ